MAGFLLGSDPELVIVNPKGKLVSAIGIINGSKYEPMKLQNGQCSYDNVNAEIGVDPCDTVTSWVDRHRSVLAQLSDVIRPNRMAVIASSDFPRSQLRHPDAKRFACEPDFDPYTVAPNFIDESASKGTLRSCGGHIHVGLAEAAENMSAQIELAKVMDIFLGIPSLLLDKDETSQRRRVLYGKAGAHRPKSYGIEYRAIGNFWISHPLLTELMWHLSSDAINAMLSKHTEEIDKDRIRDIINEGNIEAAANVVEGVVIPLLSAKTRKMMAKCIKMPHITDIYKAWEI